MMEINRVVINDGLELSRESNQNVQTKALKQGQ